MSFLTTFFNGQNRKVKAYKPISARANELEAAISSLTDMQLKAKTINFKERIKEKCKVQNANGKSEDEMQKVEKEVLDEILPEAFAAVREASKRTLGQRHFDVQIMGGAVLHNGNIAEMRTGEGKTLVATLPVYLNALTGRGVHVVTVNDYLSRRDAVWMGQIYNALGLSVGVINHESSFIYDPSTCIGDDDSGGALASEGKMQSLGEKNRQTRLKTRNSRKKVDEVLFMLFMNFSGRARVRKHTMPTSRMARTTNSALIICATIWNMIRPDCASDRSILPSSTRSILF